MLSVNTGIVTWLAKTHPLKVGGAPRDGGGGPLFAFRFTCQNNGQQNRVGTRATENINAHVGYTWPQLIMNIPRALVRRDGVEAVRPLLSSRLLLCSR